MLMTELLLVFLQFLFYLINTSFSYFQHSLEEGEHARGKRQMK